MNDLDSASSFHRPLSELKRGSAVVRSWHNAAPFVFVGLIGLGTDVTLLRTGEVLGFSLPVARAISLVLATSVTYILNRRCTFRASGLPLRSEATRYLAVTLVAGSVNYLVCLALIATDPALPHVFAAACGALPAAIFSYNGQRLVTFRDRGAPTSL